MLIVLNADVAVNCLIVVFPIIGLFFAAFHAYHTSLIEVNPDKRNTRSDSAGLLQQEDGLDAKAVNQKVFEIYSAIYKGAHSFLYEEYLYMSVFIVIFSIIIVVVLGLTNNFTNAAFTALAFVIGSLTSIISGFLGMKIGVYSNARTALQSQRGVAAGFITAFKAGSVMGFTLCSFGVLILFCMIKLFQLFYTDIDTDPLQTKDLFEAVAGFGLGGSCVGLFGRVGGGIYTKAADVGADLVGKVEAGIPEDDPRNPAVIADNVGDNVGDIAGMGADLFGSFAEATCAAMVIASQSVGLSTHYSHLMFPLTISACGIMVCFITSFFATHIFPVQDIPGIEKTLKHQLLISTMLMTPVIILLCYTLLPHDYSFNIARIGTDPNNPVAAVLVTWWKVAISGLLGLWSGLVIGYITEYYTSHSYRPVREVAESSDTGAATVIIYGLALGYKSVIIPACALAVTIYAAHTMASFYGIAIAALGILSTLSIGLTIDAFGPICDNAGGIAEMADLGEDVRDITDALDAAGNTTAAIGKGFAIGSAAFVSLALFSGFVTVMGYDSIDLLKAWPYAGLVIGAMLPYWFSALTMKSVGAAALAMVEEVRDQFRRNPGIMQGTSPPDYDSCIKISTDASLREMIAPGALVIFTPLIVGFLFGGEALAGMLTGALVSGVMMAISSSNTGGAWDNAKKYVEAGMLGDGKGKNSDNHVATVIGDTVGDPLKDTSGPALNILIKLMAIISLVFARSFPTKGWVEQLFS
eukprot:239537_1